MTGQADARPPFRFENATIGAMYAAIRAGEITCVEIVQNDVDRRRLRLLQRVRCPDGDGQSRWPLRPTRQVRFVPSIPGVKPSSNKDAAAKRWTAGTSSATAEHAVRECCHCLRLERALASAPRSEADVA